MHLFNLRIRKKINLSTKDTKFKYLTNHFIFYYKQTKCYKSKNSFKIKKKVIAKITTTDNNDNL